MATTLPNYAPYNISLTDQSAIVRFFPHRDGLITDNWNVTYTDSNFADWSYNNNFGSGISQMSAHRTVLVGAYVVIDWAGTAVFLYGTSAAEYTVQVDGQPLLTGLGADGLLFSQTDLAYGLHTAVLTVNAGELSLANATVTVGMGETGTVLQQRNISAVDTSVSPATANPTFIGDTNEWSVTDLYTNQTANGSPCIITSTYGSTLAFSISEAVGFVLYGSDDWAQGLFTVSVTSDNFGATSFITDNSIQYSPRALWTQLDLPKYMATGLDRTATYDVVITNLGANFNLASVVVYDAIPSASASTSASLIGSSPLQSGVSGSGTSAAGQNTSSSSLSSTPTGSTSPTAAPTGGSSSSASGRKSSNTTSRQCILMIVVPALFVFHFCYAGTCVV